MWLRYSQRTEVRLIFALGPVSGRMVWMTLDRLGEIVRCNYVGGDGG